MLNLVLAVSKCPDSEHRRIIPYRGNRAGPGVTSKKTTAKWIHYMKTDTYLAQGNDSK